MSPSRTPAWAPRLKPHLLRRLYESDARGIYDEDLLNEVGWGLYSRCRSFIQAMQVMDGQVVCPACDETSLHDVPSKKDILCPACGWTYPWRAYRKTIRNQQLNGGPEVITLFQEYIERFPRAQTSPHKMLLIDQLIHGFHHFLTSGRTRRPVAVNLIDGDLGFVIDFLDRLTYGPASTPGTLENRDDWRARLRGRKRMEK